MIPAGDSGTIRDINEASPTSSDHQMRFASVVAGASTGGAECFGTPLAILLGAGAGTSSSRRRAGMHRARPRILHVRTDERSSRTAPRNAERSALPGGAEHAGEHADSIGLVAAVLTTTSFFPQVVRTWRRGCDDLSNAMLAVFAAGVLLWIVFGVASRSMPVILANVLTALQVGAILVFKHRGRHARLPR